MTDKNSVEVRFVELMSLLFQLVVGLQNPVYH